MIVRGNQYYNWCEDMDADHAPRPDVWHSPAQRVSALLGPDGEPLMVGIERPMMGFDLRPKGKSK